MGGYWYVDSQPYSAVLDALIAASNSSQIVLTTGTYSDPGFIASLAASKITGTLAKSQQHAQTAYYDQPNTWAQAQTVGTLNLSTGAISSPTGLTIAAGSAWNDGYAIQLLNANTVMFEAKATGISSNVAFIGKSSLDVQSPGLGASNWWRLRADDGNAFVLSSMNTGSDISLSNTGLLTANAATFNGTLRATKPNTGLIAGFGANGVNDLLTFSYDNVIAGSCTIEASDFGPLILSSKNNSNIVLDPHGTGKVRIGTRTTTPTAMLSVGGAVSALSLTVSGTAKLGDFTAATLPSASAYTGYECNTTDSSVTTFGSTVAGGGSSNVKVRSNGTNWTVAGI